MREGTQMQTQMSRSLTKVRSLLALTALSAAVGLGACSKSSEPAKDLGGLKVALAVPGGYTVNTVTYTVNSSTGAVIRTATLDFSGAGATLSFALELRLDGDAGRRLRQPDRDDDHLLEQHGGDQDDYHHRQRQPRAVGADGVRQRSGERHLGDWNRR